MSCRRCGAALTPTSKFCPACGNPVPPEPMVQTYAAPAVSSPGGPMPGYAPPASMPGAAPVNPAVAPKSTNGLAIAAMVLGILWVYWIGSILALVFGYVAKGQINASAGEQGGKGMAIAGIVLGWVGVGALGLCIALMIIGYGASGHVTAPPRI